MNNKLKEEIRKIQNSAANEIVISWYLNRLAITISIACYAIDKDNIAEAKEWLFNAHGMWGYANIFEDLKNSNGSAEDLQAWFDKGMEGAKDHKQALAIIKNEYPEIEKIKEEPFNKEQMKLGVLFARNHLISAYQANFIDCDLKEFAKFMNLLSHVANESIDIELMMSDVLACNEQAEEWIKSAMENTSDE
ncbi:hypothetical protein [Providencia vermicola]|uniref:hypothetical protein n=1 Tax=Providencia vermicola TaxID=333965 RepID=UPI003D29CB1F